MALHKRSPLTFFVLVFALSVPFFGLGSLTDLQLMPGLSVSALATFCPLVAALLLLRRESGTTSVQALLSRSVDFSRITDKRWYLPILLLMPTVSVVVYELMRVLDLPLPLLPTQPQSAAQVLANLPIGSALLMFAAFVVGALGEELGWSGYVLDPLQKKWGALRAGVILGAVGAAWHLVPLLAMHRSATWIAWWCVYAVAFRILLVWIFNNTSGSVVGVALFHATLNLSFFLFPVNGSHFDIRLAALVMSGAAAVVVAFWGPKSLARDRAAGRR
ncbi:type II CAAX prenyl endopeptidase Rce1 family protein [Gemmatimonas sp.]|uniref:CPBP family glutamic-type intramembrane protease n=1 Tax=Gemmatimonas sp. TaxID=1962908 RepID=UPI003982FEDD